MHTMQLRRIIGYLQKLLYTVKRIRMSPTSTLNIYLFEGPIKYVPNLTSIKDNHKIYNKLMFFKTLPKRKRKMLFNIRALSVFRYAASCFKFRPHT
jgi:hypothetical protein